LLAAMRLNVNSANLKGLRHETFTGEAAWIPASAGMTTWFFDYSAA
jgi:hypothetical protein